MTTTNDLGKKTFKNTDLASILAFGLKEGAYEMEAVIKNTFCKDDANQIIAIINSLK